MQLGCRLPARPGCAAKLRRREPKRVGLRRGVRERRHLPSTIGASSTAKPTPRCVSHQRSRASVGERCVRHAARISTARTGVCTVADYSTEHFCTAPTKTCTYESATVRGTSDGTLFELEGIALMILLECCRSPASARPIVIFDLVERGRRVARHRAASRRDDRAAFDHCLRGQSAKPITDEPRRVGGRLHVLRPPQVAVSHLRDVDDVVLVRERARFLEDGLSVNP